MAYVTTAEIKHCRKCRIDLGKMEYIFLTNATKKVTRELMLYYYTHYYRNFESLCFVSSQDILNSVANDLLA